VYGLANERVRIDYLPICGEGTLITIDFGEPAAGQP
jgi:hypothetical protein